MSENSNEKEYEVVNMVISFKLGFPVDLYKMAYNWEEDDSDVEYEPEQFPGVVVRVYRGVKKLSMLVFRNGSVIGSGLRDEDDARWLVNWAKEHISKYISTSGW